MHKEHLWDYLPEFGKALQEQLTKDEKRWGDTWKHRSIEGQEERMLTVIRDYYDQWEHGNIPIPWLKIAGGVLICWVREYDVALSAELHREIEAGDLSVEGE